MYERLITTFSSETFMTSVANQINFLTSTIDHYLNGADNLRMASIILMLLAVVLFLFLVIVIYVKSIVGFMKSGNSQAEAEAEAEEEESRRAEEEAERLLEEEDLDRELERELEKELELARSEQLRQEQAQHQLKEQQKLNEKQAEQEKAEEQAKHRDEGNDVFRAKSYENKGPVVDFDWKIGQVPAAAESQENLISPETLKYQQSKKDLSDLLGLIIDMIGRGVDDLKIAQTVMFRNQGQASEDDILQTIDAVRSFIALCVDHKFEKLDNKAQLPDEGQALYHLAQGDTAPSLALLESLMDQNIDTSAAQSVGPKRDETFAATADYACTFGTLAAISDVHLATGAFELSIELAPQNVNAWSRVADMYARAETKSKAVWAYQNVLNMADEEIYPRQVANANKMLSRHLYDQGNSLQAAKLYNASKQYYDSLGINRRLDRQEVEIVEIIEANQSEELEATINKILGRNVLRSYSKAE